MELYRMLEHVSAIHGIPIRICKREATGAYTSNLCLLTGNVPLPAALNAALDEAATLDVPVLISYKTVRYYAVISTGAELVVLGPIRLSVALPLQRNYHDSLPLSSDEQEHMMDVPAFLRLVLMLSEFISGKAWTEDQLLACNSEVTMSQQVIHHFADKLYDDRENESHHNAYSQELRMLTSIERGDLNMLRRAQQEKSSGTLGTLAPQADRSARNLCICVIALISRAAIRGGVNAEAAFTMCDAYILKIEEMTDLTALPALIHGAQINFATMVRAANQQKKKTPDQENAERQHPLVERCKNYVYTHLHGRVSLAEAAEALHTSPNYLSSLFSKTEGMTFTDFVMREKVSIAKSLLLYSSLSSNEIAATLGFVSQSHLGKCFRAWTGMTPMQFRKRFTVTELEHQ